MSPEPNFDEMSDDELLEAMQGAIQSRKDVPDWVVDAAKAAYEKRHPPAE